MCIKCVYFGCVSIFHIYIYYVMDTNKGCRCMRCKTLSFANILFIFEYSFQARLYTIRSSGTSRAPLAIDATINLRRGDQLIQSLFFISCSKLN